MHIVTTGDGSKTLFSERYQQTYHSTHGAVTESKTVFIEGSNLEACLSRAKRDKRPVRVLEIGFGLGLNFLLTADLAMQQQARLDYVAIENDPVDSAVLRDLDYGEWLQHPSLADDICDRLQQPDLKTHRQPTAHYSLQKRAVTGISLTIHQKLEMLIQEGTKEFDIVYLDAFSPESNAECWNQGVLDGLYDALVDAGTLTTYSAKGSVRRGLATAGFLVTKRPGPPGKREIIRAEKAGKVV